MAAAEPPDDLTRHFVDGLYAACREGDIHKFRRLCEQLGTLIDPSSADYNSVIHTTLFVAPASHGRINFLEWALDCTSFAFTPKIAFRMIHVMVFEDNFTPASSCNTLAGLIDKKLGGVYVLCDERTGRGETLFDLACHPYHGNPTFAAWLLEHCAVAFGGHASVGKLIHELQVRLYDREPMNLGLGGIIKWLQKNSAAIQSRAVMSPEARRVFVACRRIQRASVARRRFRRSLFVLVVSSRRRRTRDKKPTLPPELWGWLHDEFIPK